MRNAIWAAPVLFLGMQICASADVVPPGTQIQVRTDGPIELHHWDEGRIFPARVVRDVYARDGDLAIPRGSAAELIVRRTGPEQMTLDLESVTAKGRRYVMDTSGPQFHMRHEEYQNGSGLLGSIVGAISGGNATVVTRGHEIRVPPNARLTFQLQEPLRIADWGDRGYEREHSHYHHDQDGYR